LRLVFFVVFFFDLCGLALRFAMWISCER